MTCEIGVKYSLYYVVLSCLRSYLNPYRCGLDLPVFVHSSPNEMICPCSILMLSSVSALATPLLCSWAWSIRHIIELGWWAGCSPTRHNPRKEGRQMGAIALWELLFGRITIYFYFHNAHLTCASIMSFVTKADWCCWLSNENSLKILQDTELVFPHSSLSTTLVSAVIVRLKYVHFCYFVLVDTNVFLHWLAQPGWGSSLFLFCLWGDGILYHTVVIAPEILSSHFFSSDFYSATLCLHRNWFKCLTPILLWMKWMFLDYIAMMLAGMELGLMDPLTELEITRIKV